MRWRLRQLPFSHTRKPMALDATIGPLEWKSASMASVYCLTSAGADPCRIVNFWKTTARTQARDFCILPVSRNDNERLII